MKIALVGKGGTGKTIIAASLARICARQGKTVLAVDVDSNPTLGYSLGVSTSTMEKIVPLNENEEILAEKVASSYNGAFKLNPDVTDIVGRFALPAPDGVSFLVVGNVVANQGCLCPSHSLLKAMLRNLVLKRDEMVILDLEAGLETFGRGTLRGIDRLLVVSEPTAKSLITVNRIVALAENSGISADKVFLVLNKCTDGSRELFTDKKLPEMAARIPLSMKVIEAEIRGVPIIDHDPSGTFMQELVKIPTGAGLN